MMGDCGMESPCGNHLCNLCLCKKQIECLSGSTSMGVAGLKMRGDGPLGTMCGEGKVDETPVPAHPAWRL